LKPFKSKLQAQRNELLGIEAISGEDESGQSSSSRSEAIPKANQMQVSQLGGGRLPPGHQVTRSQNMEVKPSSDDDTLFQSVMNFPPHKETDAEGFSEDR